LPNTGIFYSKEVASVVIIIVVKPECCTDRDLDASVEVREFQESINSLLDEYDDRFVSRGYEELLDEKITEIQREAERLEQRLWGGKEKDFKF
jgi:hypothetical protein